jgi:hypothetical protein
VTAVNRNTFWIILAAHLGFQAAWIVLFLLNRTGLFFFIPLVGLYNAFVLGFLGESVLISPARAALLGLVAFLGSGFVSASFIALFRPRSLWLPAVFSIAVTVVLFVSASLIRYTFAPQPALQLPTTTGRADIDQISMALKSEYHSAGEAPPYLQGRPTLLSFDELLPMLRLLPKDFRLETGAYTYCNLPPATWKGVKNDARMSRWPLVWSTRPDPNGQRLVLSVDLKSDMFHDEVLVDDAFRQMIRSLEAAASKHAGTNIIFQIND